MLRHFAATVLLLALVLGLAWCGESLLSATRIWTGGGATDLWSDPANWSGGVPIAGDDVIFGSSARFALVDDFVSLSLLSLSFQANNPAYQLSILGGGAVSPILSIMGAGILNSSGEDHDGQRELFQ